MRREVRAARLEKVAQVRSQRSIAPASMQRSLESTFLARLATLSRYGCRACTLGPRNRFSARTLVWVVAPLRLKPPAQHVPVQGLTGALGGTEPVFVVAAPAHGPRPGSERLRGSDGFAAGFFAARCSQGLPCSRKPFSPCSRPVHRKVCVYAVVEAQKVEGREGRPRSRGLVVHCTSLSLSRRAAAASEQP